jgi:murein L,D-transpeptidase YcbB/YkuD
MLKTLRFLLVVAVGLCALTPIDVAWAQSQATPLSGASRAAIYRTLQGDLDPTLVPLAALDDRTLSEMIVRYAQKELGQRLRPASIERMWAIAPPRRDVRGELDSAIRDSRLENWLTTLAPPFPEYRALRSAYCRYASIVADGGWSALSAGKPLRAGERSPAVVQLRARLAAEGYVVAKSATPDLFDADLGGVVADFQERHGLTADGVVGAATLAALNVSAEARLVQIGANLERWRWLPHDLPDDRVEVDSGFAEARLYQGGRLVLHMRAVVGKPSTKTPMFKSQIEGVIFNPPWNVPDEIAANEVLPRARRDAGYFAREGYVRTANGIQQLPGPKNALGQIKFDLPSPFGVYLHDTPSKSAFDRDVRALSHGCMRLQKPRELAAAALGWSPEQIDQAVSAGTTRRVALPRPLPLFVVHTTALAGVDGKVRFRPDVYGWDHLLNEALAGVGQGGLAQAQSHATDCAQGL